jgi:predicted acylesterase/phospholipase RssA
METPAPLPQFEAEQFKLTEPPECDIIMKGGITSGIVYPYAILEIATKYRFRSLGGTSAGAIAAAFAAAAEYSRSVRKDAAGFIRLKQYCDALPDQLLSLFQPDAELDGVAALIRRAAAGRGPMVLLQPLTLRVLLAGSLGGSVAAAVIWLLSNDLLAGVLGFLLGLMVGSLVAAIWIARSELVRPVLLAITTMPNRMFGFCSGLTRSDSQSPAITDWLHRALQDIAFGSPDWPEVLTFGHLETTGRKIPPIELRMVTTNLSMMRPHTLPELGMQAGFREDEWRALFPTAIVDHMIAKSKPWKGMWFFPGNLDLPVLVATRMSLSFPLLFKAIPLWADDHEYFRVMEGLGGKPERLLRRLWMSDGGISSNFPIHMFDAPLPTRPTFAFSLDALRCAPGAVQSRVLLPSDTMTGLGVQIHDIKSLAGFAGQVFYSAKDWQDQLLSGITGQRERIARIFLAPDEGGLNLEMAPQVSRSLMSYGLSAGKVFTSGQFSFDEHCWRRTLAFYRNSTEWLGRASAVWNTGFHEWYRSYSANATSYRLSRPARRTMRIAIDVTLAPPRAEDRLSEKMVKNRLPRRVGKLRGAAEY